MIGKKEDEVHIRTEPVSIDLGRHEHDPRRHQKSKPIKFTVLEDAGALIYGDRENEYGPPAINLKDIAVLWTAYLKVLGYDVSLEGKDTSMMLQLMKMARCAKHKKPVKTSRGSVVDMAGYVGLLERLEE